MRCHQYLKDTIWKQFTTVKDFHNELLWCHQYLKDTIWKQFTTLAPKQAIIPLVSPIPQRYNLKAIHNRTKRMKWDYCGVTNTSKIQSESNSQHTFTFITNVSRCHQYLKDTIWKQFTTRWMTWCYPTGVSPIPQRYNLKAIHNWFTSSNIQFFGVTNTSKIQSESNSQRCHSCAFSHQRCHQYLKDTIWKQFTTCSELRSLLWWVSPIPQRYNLKAIHNRQGSQPRHLRGVTNTSKIQSESNSQLLIRWLCNRHWCHQYLKDTIWKQFTTH